MCFCYLNHGIYYSTGICFVNIPMRRGSSAIIRYQTSFKYISFAANKDILQRPYMDFFTIFNLLHTFVYKGFCCPV